MYLASALWVPAGEEGTPGGPGDAFYWFVTLVPILACYLVANFLAFTQIFRSRDKASLVLWFAIVSLWLGVVGYDHHRAFRNVDAKYSFATVHDSGA